MKKGKLKILIITFLILFSVIIIFTIFNKTGIISNIITKNEKNSESEARAKLVSILETAANEKTNNSSYNSNDFLTNLLEQENIVVKDNIVSLSNYNFVIDRDSLSISESLGETSVNVSYDISNYFSDITADNQNVASAKINIKSNIVIDSITFENSDGTLDVEPVNNTTFSKDINIIHNKEYSLTVTTCDGKVNFKTYKEDASEKAGSLLAIAKNGIDKSGYYKVAVNGEAYTIHAYVYDEDTTLTGGTFGDANDVATASDYAKNMVLLKVNGNLTTSGTTTVYSSPYGGPKGFFIYCTGIFTNNGTVTMQGKGAKAVGQNVYLYKNFNGTYEYVPAVGGAGGLSVTASVSRLGSSEVAGNAGKNGSKRRTGGGGSGQAYAFTSTNTRKMSSTSGSGSAGTSYSSGSGGGGSSSSYMSSSTTTIYGNNAEINGGAGGNSSIYGCGAGNPTLTNNSNISYSRTAGLLIVYGNSILNNGTFNSNGSIGFLPSSSPLYCGCSGGGSINIFYTDTCTIGTVSAVGGDISNSTLDGAGGNGSISSGCIATGTYVAD